MVDDSRGRHAAIASLGLLDRRPPPVVRHLLEAARLLTGAVDAQLNVLTDDYQQTLVDAGGSFSRMPLEDSVCARVLDQPGREHLVPDASADSRFSDAGAVERGGLRGYAASKLVTSSGVVIGTVCVFSHERLELEGRLAGALSSLSDVVMMALESQASYTAARRQLAEASSHTEDLERTQRHLEAFAAQVGHDVQSPLSAISMSMELLEDHLLEMDLPEPQASEALLLLAPALSSSRRLQGMVTGLLDFALHGGRLTQEPVDLAELVHEVLADLAVPTGTRLEVGPLVEAWADRAMLRSLVQNYLTNAFKYAGGAPEPVVRVTAGTDGRCVRLEVHDNGPGVPEDQRGDVFEPLVRGHGLEVRSLPGIGIGLATCRRVAEAHGGRAGVEASPLGGSCFWVELPESHVVGAEAPGLGPAVAD